VFHKHHSIIRVGAGLIQFVHGSHSHMATGVTSSRILLANTTPQTTWYQRARCASLESRPRKYGKLVDNFSHESDVTSLQDLFTSRPQKTPFYFIIVFHINGQRSLFQFNAEFLPSSRLLVFTLAVYATASRPIFPWWWAHVCPLCLLWIAIHIGRRPSPYVYFTVRDILFCRSFIPIDFYKRTSPRGPEAKHLRPRRMPMVGVYVAGRLSFT